MQMKKGEIIEVDISTLAFGGKGLGKLDGKAVFVDLAVPGDKVKASVTKIKTSYLEAKLVEILVPSEKRVKPKCPYFGVCGGCQFQHLPYENQLEIKKQHVIDAFERIGELANPPVMEILRSENHYYYRNKMEFSFGYDAEMKFAMGMHLPGRRYDILDLKECHLQSEISAGIVNAVREWAISNDLKPYRFQTEEGELKALYIRESKRTNERMVNLVTAEKVPENFEELLGKLSAVLAEMEVTSFYWSQIISHRGSPRRTVEYLISGKRTITEKMVLANGDELSFEIHPQAFFQVNTLQAEVLYYEVVKLVEENPCELIFDLFCGTGTIGLFLAKHCKKVLGVELNKDAVKSANSNAQKNKIFNIDFFAGDVAKVLEDLKEKPSLIVVDPPRAGMTAKMIKQVSDFGTKKLIYVSCNPATMARDCLLLREFGFKVKKIQPVDMFPQTFHIENVALLERE